MQDCSILLLSRNTKYNNYTRIRVSNKIRQTPVIAYGIQCEVDITVSGMHLEAVTASLKTLPNWTKTIRKIKQSTVKTAKKSFIRPSE